MCLCGDQEMTPRTMYKYIQWSPTDCAHTWQVTVIVITSECWKITYLHTKIKWKEQQVLIASTIKTSLVVIIINPSLLVSVGITLHAHSSGASLYYYYIGINEFRSFVCGDYHSDLLLVSAIYRWTLWRHLQAAILAIRPNPIVSKLVLRLAL